MVLLAENLKTLTGKLGCLFCVQHIKLFLLVATKVVESSILVALKRNRVEAPPSLSDQFGKSMKIDLGVELFFCGQVALSFLGLAVLVISFFENFARKYFQDPLAFLLEKDVIGGEWPLGAVLLEFALRCFILLGGQTTQVTH